MLAASILIAQTPVATPAALSDPYAIFGQARQAWQSSAYPNQVRYTVAIVVSKKGVTSVVHYDSYYDAKRDAVRVVATSQEELAHPYKPTGINTYLNLFGTARDKGVTLSAPQRTFDFLGVPILTPNYSFGIDDENPRVASADATKLVREIRKEFHDADKPAPTNVGGVREIASVESTYHTYTITLDGLESLNGHLDYHLSLLPKQAPLLHRLREMWVQTSTFATDRIITAGNFLFDGVTTVPWTIDCQQLDGAQYIQDEYTNSPFSISRHAYDSAIVVFQNIRPYPIPQTMWIATFAVNGETGMPPLAEP